MDNTGIRGSSGVVWVNVTLFCALMLFLTTVLQREVLHGSTRGVLEPGIESELHVVGSGDFSVYNFVAMVETRYWFG